GSSRSAKRPSTSGRPSMAASRWASLDASRSSKRRTPGLRRCTAPAFSETWFVVYLHEAVFLVALIVSFFVFDRPNIPDRLRKSLVIEPPDPFERGELDVFEPAPRTALADDFRHVEADHRFGECAVIRVASASDGWLDAGLRQPLGIANG